VSVEMGHERFAIEDNFLIDVVDHRLIRNFSSLLIIGCPTEV
jgi:hypothetical protein